MAIYDRWHLFLLGINNNYDMLISIISFPYLNTIWIVDVINELVIFHVCAGVVNNH